MKHLRTIGDVMTHTVIAVGRDAPFKLARAVPGVVDVDAPLDVGLSVH